MTKRRRFIVTSLLLTLGFLVVQFLDNQLRFFAIGILSVLTVVLFYWELREGIQKDMTRLSLVLPFFFTIGVGLFWFLLPSSLFTQLPILIFYGFGIYSLCLTTNIYTVSALKGVRKIALIRAARGVGFVLSLVTSFLIFDAILSTKAQYLFSSLSISLVSFPLFLQGFWAITLNKEYRKDLTLLALVSSLVVGQVALSLYFWPVTVVVGSLFLTVAVYVLLGLGQARLEARLFSQTVREYLFVGLLVFLGMFIATRWGG